MSDLKKIEDRLYSKTLDFISYSFRTEKEVKDRLAFLMRKVSFPSASDKDLIADRIMTDLKDSGYINDEEYVKRYVEGLVLSPKAKSIREASQFLYKKGISGELSEKYLRHVGEVLEEKSLHTLVEKKMRVVKNARDPKSVQKLVRYLVSKGYSYEKARAEVDRAVSLK